MIRILLLVICIVSGGSLAEEAVQTDWSGGGGGDDPVDDWGVGFEDGQDVSWLALPGELPLSSTPKTPVEHALGSPEGPLHIDVADVDGDGDTDVLAAVEWDECICWYENEDGLGTNWDCHVIQFEYVLASCVHAADIDGDGDTDVLGTSANNQEINWWSNDDGMGTEWTGYLIKGGFWGASTVHTADLDGDGDLDIMGGAVTVDDLIWWENEDGTGTELTEHMIDDSYWNPHSVRAADIDGDGDLDLLAASGGDDDINWWSNDDGQGGSWTEHLVDGSFDGVCSISVVDIDGDGDPDVVGAGPNDANDIRWSENLEGTGETWELHYIDDNFDDAVYAHAADIDGDGDFDVVGAARGADEITWWSNDGQGVSWTEYNVTGGYSKACCAVTGDIDGDGDLDVIGAGYEENSIDWWEVTEFLSSGELTSTVLDTDPGGDANGTGYEWGVITWEAAEPGSSELKVYVRAADDPAGLGDWMLVPESGVDLSPYAGDGCRYLQYKLELDYGTAEESPIMQELSVNWEVASGLDGVELAASPAADGVLLGWTVSGDVPASVRVLRGGSDPVAVSGSLPGETRRWLDRGVEPGESYVYWLEATDNEGQVIRCGPTEAVVVPEAAQRLSLAVPYPSPARDTLTLTYFLPEAQSATLSVYDISGRRIFTQLLDAVPGRHPLVLDVAGYPQGIYIARIAGEGASATRRFVISR